MVFINIAIHFGFNTLKFDLKSVAIISFIIALTILFTILSQKFIEKPISKLFSGKG